MLDGSNTSSAWTVLLVADCQVYIQEDEEQHIHYKNLSVHRAGNEEDALNLVTT